MSRHHPADARTSPAVARTVEVDRDTRVSALLQTPPDAFAGLVLGHGAGAGMQHRFMQALADGLVQRDVAVLRYQFPFAERGSRRPDPAPLARATVRAAAAHAKAAWGALPLFAGGKSFGGRMTSQAEAEQPLAEVCGLVFFGFPLHPSGKPAVGRAQHLAAVARPMLFVQGTRDKLAELALLQPVVSGLGTRARLHAVEAADHGFDVLVRSGRRPQEVLDELLDATCAWLHDITAPPG